MKCILTLIACSALVPLGRAFDLRNVALAYPSTGTDDVITGEVTQVCIGQFSDDAIADGAILCGGRAFLMYAPERFDTYLPLDATGLTGPFTSMTKVTLSGGHEGLIASTSSGLALLQWSTSSRRLIGSDLSASTWANATQLQTITIGSTTSICGISSTGTSILYGVWTASTNSFSSSGSDTGLNTIRSLAAVNWTSGLAFAYDDGSGLKIIPPGAPSGGGTPIYHYDNAYTGQPLLLRMPRSTTDYVIWATQNPFGSGEVLTVVRSDNTLAPNPPVESPVYFGSMTAAHLTLANIDNDGLQDLVITRSDDHYAVVLYRQSSGSMSFGYSSAQSGEQSPLILSLYNTWGSCGSAPAVGAGDLDGDGDDDLIFAGNTICSTGAYVYFADGINEDFYDTDVSHIKPWLARLIGFDAWPGGRASAHLCLSFSNWPSLAPIPSASNASARVHVTVWARPTVDSEIQPQPLYDDYFAPSSLPPSNTVPLDLAIPPAYTGSAPQYLFLSMSYVLMNSSGTAVVQSYPTNYGQFQLAGWSGCGMDAGPILNGGLNRPPPPPSSSAPSP